MAYMNLKHKIRYGKLKVVGKPFAYKYRMRVSCLCDCGRKTIVPLVALRNGNTKSCGGKGCRAVTHGLSYKLLYRVWANIKSRCLNPKDRRFKYYGGRGIAICKMWLNNPITFFKWAVINGYKKGLYIDRRNNDKGYTPSNCRFVTSKINSRNKSRVYLSEELASYIRHLYRHTFFSQNNLAFIFGVHRNTINSLIRNKSWIS